MSEVRMATRDASWYDRPNTRSPKVYHVIVSPAYVAACDPFVQLVEESEVSLESGTRRASVPSASLPEPVASSRGHA